MTPLHRAELCRVAAHEAGHMTCAYFFGIDGQIELWRAGDGYAGQFRVMPSKNADVNRLVYLGGGAAEALWKLGTPVSQTQLLSSARASLSAIDVALAGPFDDRHLAVAVHLCSQHWTDLVARANEAIQSTLRHEAIASSLQIFNRSQPRAAALSA